MYRRTALIVLVLPHKLLLRNILPRNSFTAYNSIHYLLKAYYDSIAVYLMFLRSLLGIAELKFALHFLYRSFAKLPDWICHFVHPSLAYFSHCNIMILQHKDVNVIWITSFRTTWELFMSMKRTFSIRSYGLFAYSTFKSYGCPEQLCISHLLLHIFALSHLLTVCKITQV